MRAVLPAAWLSIWALLLAASPALCALVEIPGVGGWKIEAPAGFKMASGSECKDGDRLCFVKGKAVLAVNQVDTLVPQCGWANERIPMGVSQGSSYGRSGCEATFRSGSKAYRLQSQNGKYMELLFRFSVAATDADNIDAQKTFDEIKTTLQPPPPPPKPKEAPRKEAPPAPVDPNVLVPDSSGWHFIPPKAFDMDEPDSLRFAKLKRTQDGVTAWIDFQFADSIDEMCAHGGDRVGERYESIRWGRHSLRSACMDPFGKASDGRQLKARSSEFMIEIEPDRFVRVRLHYHNAELRSVDDADIPPDLKEQSAKSFDRACRSIAPKGIDVPLED